MTLPGSAEKEKNEFTAESAPSPQGYTLWAVFRRNAKNPTVIDVADVPEAVHELDDVIAQSTTHGVVTRGLYDVSGLRADADLMVWLHGPEPEELQWALRQLRRTRLFRTLLPTWNAMGVHRDAEFNRSHVPGFLRGKEPLGWLCVYPFVRSYDWYLLPEQDRSRMLAEHGRRGAAFHGVLANTVAAFALGDYEWILPLEADNLTDLVDMMRDLRYTEARLHVRDELPFFTGRRIQSAELVEVLQ